MPDTAGRLAAARRARHAGPPQPTFTLVDEDHPPAGRELDLELHLEPPAADDAELVAVRCLAIRIWDEAGETALEIVGPAAARESDAAWDRLTKDDRLWEAAEAAGRRAA